MARCPMAPMTRPTSILPSFRYHIIVGTMAVYGGAWAFRRVGTVCRASRLIGPNGSLTPILHSFGHSNFVWTMWTMDEYGRPVRPAPTAGASRPIPVSLRRRPGSNPR
jgi:hypothetical protein